MTAPQLLSIPQAATRLGVSRTQVYRLIARHGLRTVTTGTGSRPAVRVYATDVDQLIEDLTRDAPRRKRAG